MDHAPPRPRTAPLLLAVGLAHAGGVVAYLPLITLLLPMRVEALAHLAKIDLLTAAVLAGGMAASLANIVFGWLSDVSVARGSGRRRWVMAGLVALAASYPAMAFARTPVELVGAVV
ncbi:MAG: MFS transporter, partial [Pseudomonadota bacterium]|nr:MFS transporter [Pseudomonadota bacterium]